MRYLRISKDHAILEDGSHRLVFNYDLRGMLGLPAVEVGRMFLVDIVIELSCDEDALVWYGVDFDGSSWLYTDRPKWDDFLNGWIRTRGSDTLYIGDIGDIVLDVPLCERGGLLPVRIISGSM